MAWAARTGRLDTSKIEDKEWRDKINKIANSDKFPDKSLKKMASTKHRDEETDKLIPYRIGKGTPEEPERMRKPYKKKVQEGFHLKGLNDFISEKESIIESEFEDFYNGYIDAMYIMNDNFVPNISQMFIIYKEIRENAQLNPGMNVMGMGPVSMPGNPGTTTSFHNQEPGSGDIPYYKKEEDEEDEEDDDK
jgi:hypothetical protein